LYFSRDKIFKMKMKNLISTLDKINRKPCPLLSEKQIGVTC
jgi:hypothetical protein